MRTIGLLGGMSWESTLEAYRLLNLGVKERLGGLHSARLVLSSVDFAEIEALQHAGRWDEAGARLASEAQALERAGAAFLMLCTNTMHRVADAIERAVSIPLLHIADPTAEAIGARGLRTVGLLGTRFTMEQAFFKERLEARGLSVVVPPEAARALVHRVIYEELCLGVVHDESRRALVRVSEELAEAGAEGLILGCTELGLLLRPADVPRPVFDTTTLHAAAAVAESLREALPLTGGRTLFLGAASGGRPMISGPFSVLVPAYTEVDLARGQALTGPLLEAGCVELCCVGPRAEALHDELDWIVEARDRLDVVTTWDGELGAACEYFLRGGGPPVLLALLEEHPRLRGDLAQLLMNSRRSALS